MFLYIDKDSEEVKIRPEAMALLSVKELYASDKRPGEIEKPFFKRCLKYIYHTYYNEHPVLKNTLPNERKTRVAEMYFSDDARIDINGFEKNKKVLAVINDYLISQDTVSSKSYRTILKKIEEVIEHIGTIPLKKYQQIKDQRVTCMVAAGENDTLIEKEFFITTEIEIDNIKEYTESLKTWDQLLDFEEKIKIKLQHEKQDIEISNKTMLELDSFNTTII